MNIIQRAVVTALAATAIGSGTLNAAHADTGIGTAATYPSYPYVAAHCPGAVPGTDAGVTCAEHGWLIRKTITIDPNEWVRWTTLPACPTDEAEGGPCVWDARRQGNHRGQSYWLTGHNVVVPLAGVRR